MGEVSSRIIAWILKASDWTPVTPTEKQEHFYTHMPEASVGMAELDPRNPDFQPEWQEDHHPDDASGPTAPERG